MKSSSLLHSAGKTALRICFFLLLANADFTAMAQADVEQIAARYEKDLKDPAAVPYGHNKAAGRFYRIRGFSMYAEVYGSGQPLLIIHGNGGSINNFIYQIPYFSKNYKVIVADSRAQGRSADPGDSLSYEMMADDYSALLDSMKVDSACVIGWSDGGINGLLLAIRHPGKVKKLAVTGANLRPDTTAAWPEVLDMFEPFYDSLSHITKRNAEQRQTYKLVNLLVREPHIPLTDLQKIAAPTLVIGGDHDVIKEEHTFEIYRNIRRAYLWILPASGHSTPIMYSEDFNRVIGNFFAKPFRTFEGAKRFS